MVWRGYCYSCYCCYCCDCCYHHNHYSARLPVHVAKEFGGRGRADERGLVLEDALRLLAPN
eukprot:2950944-Prymnesium_polylepis.1